MSPQEYDKLVSKNSPKSNCLKNCLAAFVAGGAICAAGQGVLLGFGALGLDENAAKTATSVTLIFTGALLTALGVYDKLARRAGAGALIPITGFANAMAAPAIEFKTEGLITGTGAKMFIIAGPVLVYGISASVAYGAVLWLLHLFGITLF